MPSKEQRNLVDAQWQALQPGWGPDDYKGERRMLYGELDDGENIDALWGGGWKAIMGGGVVESHERGVIAATDKRILFLNSGRLSKNISAVQYEEIRGAKGKRAGEVELTGSSVSDISHVACLPSGAADPFINFVQKRLLNDTASVEAAVSQFVESGERVQFWKRCSGGEETVSQQVRITGAGGGGGTPQEKWWELGHLDNIVAVATDRRLLMVSDFSLGDLVSVPYANLLTVMRSRDRVKFARRGRSQVYVVRTSQSEARELAELMQGNWAASSGPNQKRPRILAEWQMQQPIWSHRKIHDKERNRLAEIMEDGERLEGLLGAHFLREESGETTHEGIVAATDRRLIFLSEGILDKHAGHLPYECIGDIAYAKGRVHEEIDVISTPGNPNYRISNIDGARPHNTRQSGYAEEFAVLVRGFLSHSAVPGPNSTPPPNSVTSATDKISRINAQWRERSPDWKLDDHKNEREKLYELLSDDENIELLTEARYKAEVKGAQGHDVVVATTDRRIVLVYNGAFGEHVNELSYGDFERVEFKPPGFLGLPRITLIGRAGAQSYRFEGAWEKRESNRFINRVQKHLAGSPAPPSAPAPGTVAPDTSKRTRINAQWQERSPDWKLNTRKNEREKLYEVLEDDEDIERLIQGYYRLDAKGAESRDVVVAATDRRLIFVYNGWAGTHLSWMGYHQLERVEDQDGFFSGQNFRIITRGGGAIYVVEVRETDVENLGEGKLLFVDCVRSHLGP